MIIQFTEAELKNMTIQPVERRERSAAYLVEREEAWNARMQQVLSRNGTMWNGEVYTLENIRIPGEDQVILQMSTCEYKDIVFRVLKGRPYIASRYGEEHLYGFSGVNCAPITQDGKFLFGIRGDRPEDGPPPIGGIGGTLNKDEMELHTFADIRRCMLREIQEETALECADADLRFFCLNIGPHYYNFWFTVRLPIHSEDVNRYHRDGEFSRLVAITEKEALEMKSPMTTGFQRWRPYLRYLLNI